MSRSAGRLFDRVSVTSTRSRRADARAFGRPSPALVSGKWEERLAKDGADVMAAARALDEKIRIETEVHTRTERDIDSVEVRRPTGCAGHKA